MKLSAWRCWLGAAAVTLAAALPAQATVVTFEDVLPTIITGDIPGMESLTSGGYVFTSDGFGFSGVDGPGAFSIYGNAPGNATDQFLFALNSDGITMTAAAGGFFSLLSIDAAFIAPVGGLGPDLFSGELYVIGQYGPNPFDFVLDILQFPPSDANGDFNFTTFTLGNLHKRAVSSVFFLSCVYDANGFCSFENVGIEPQFALDNIRIPEPATAGLAIAALGLIGLRRRVIR